MIAKRIKVTSSLDPPAPESKPEYVTGKIYRGATKKFFSGNGNGKDKQPSPSPPEPKAEPKPKSDPNQNKVPSANPIKAPVNNGPYHCETCNRTLKSRAGYLSHMRSKLHARRAAVNKSTPQPAPKPDPKPEPKVESNPTPQPTPQPEPKPEPKPDPQIESKNNDLEEIFNKLYNERESKRLAQKELRRKEKELQRKKEQEEKAARRKVKQEAFEQYKKLLSSENVQRLISGTKQPATPKPVAELAPKPKPKPKPKAKPFERISDTRHKRYSEGDINYLTGRKVRLRTKLVRGNLIEYYE